MSLLHADSQDMNPGNVNKQLPEIYIFFIFSFSLSPLSFTEQIQKQHDNFINRTSIKNQCNKPMRSTSQQQHSNMTCPPPPQSKQQLQQQNEQSSMAAVINGCNNSSNMCQKSPSSSRARKTSFAADEVDGTTSTSSTTTTASVIGAQGEDEADINDNINHISSSAASASCPTSSVGISGVQLRSSKPSSLSSSSTAIDTIPRCSLSSNHLQYHHNTAAAGGAVNKYGSNTMATTSSSSLAGRAGTNAAASMTADNQLEQRFPKRTILSNTTLMPTNPASSSSSANDTSGDNSQSDLTADASTPSLGNHADAGDATTASNCRSKLAALANLDLALNLSNLPLDVDDDDDPYFVLQEYLERVKVSTAW